MREDHVLLFQTQAMEIAETAPSMVAMVKDMGNKWDVEEMVYIFLNKNMRIFLERIGLPTKIGDKPFFYGQADVNSVQAHFVALSEKLKLGSDTIAGPFLLINVDAIGESFYLEYRLRHLGHDDDGHAVFVGIANDITTAVYQKRMHQDEHFDPLIELSDRERSVVSLLQKTMSTQEIADELGIALRTVENHRHHIRKKLNILDKTKSITGHIRAMRVF